MKTEEAIENLATAFSKLSRPEHREIYLAALEALVQLSKSERSREMLVDMDNSPEMKAMLLFHLGVSGNGTVH